MSHTPRTEQLLQDTDAREGRVHELQAELPGHPLALHVLVPNRSALLPAGCCFYGQTKLRMSSLGSLTLAYLCIGARLSLARVRVPPVQSAGAAHAGGCSGEGGMRTR